MADTRKDQETSLAGGSLEHLRQQLQDWRTGRKLGERIPASLWAAAGVSSNESLLMMSANTGGRGDTQCRRSAASIAMSATRLRPRLRPPAIRRPSKPGMRSRMLKHGLPAQPVGKRRPGSKLGLREVLLFYTVLFHSGDSHAQH